MRTRFEASIDKRQALKEDEANGLVADSKAVRLAMLWQVHIGKIILQDAQKQLKKIQNSAKKNGLKTRNQSFNQG